VAVTAPAPTPAQITAVQVKPSTAVPGRMVSIDAYRGLVMFLMMAEMLHLSGLARHFPGSAFWQIVGFNTQHVEWTGCSLHDLIQPGFSFLVGVALPFSVASRLARGQTFGFLLGHAVWRSLLLILLGVFLRSVNRPQTSWTFEDTLSQIGLGYTFLFLLAFRGVKFQAAALVLILVGYWAAFALYPLPAPGFDYPAVGVPADWPHHLSGFAAHWDKNSNPAWAFDQWFLNLFPREHPFVDNGGGYATLSFIPTLGTMILGLIAGGWLREQGAASRKLLKLAAAGAICLALGWLLEWSGICPSVKRIWTPAWTLYSGGWCFMFLAGFFALTDAIGWRRWAFPLVVIGMNSIAIYVLVHLVPGFIIRSIKTHLGQDVFKAYGSMYEQLLAGAAALLVLWLILLWMYRRRIFLKI
jgi:heparan-alpha-glucosaminide N-acetyltransferase